MPTGVAGSTLILEAVYQDGAGAAVVPTTPLVDIIDPNGVTVVNNAVPTATVQLGRYEYAFAIPAAGPLGSWTALWTGIVGGANVEASEVFHVHRVRPRTGTCEPWAETGDVCAPCNDYDFDTTLLEDSLQFASDVLFDLTGRQWPGECEDTIRPCGYRRGDSCGCLSSATCGCRRLSQLELPGQPVAEVSEVLIDGVVVDPARYRVDDHRWLVYLPESDSADRQGWPCCARLDLADTEPDTWSVTYSYGQAPPIGGRIAAASLACQLALSCSPDSSACRLPKRVTSLTRQGISMAVLDPLTLFADGLTGLSEIDLWVSSIQAGRKRRRAQVFVPGAGASTARHVDT